MKADEIIKEIAKSNDYKRICYNIAGRTLGKDLFQELFVILCQYDRQRIEELHANGQLRWLIVKILKVQFHDPRKEFFKKYRTNHDELGVVAIIDDEPIDIEEVVKAEELKLKVLSELSTDGLSQDEWYERTIFLEYMEAGSAYKLEKITGICRKSIAETVLKFKNKIRAKYST